MSSPGHDELQGHLQLWRNDLAELARDDRAGLDRTQALLRLARLRHDIEVFWLREIEQLIVRVK